MKKILIYKQDGNFVIERVNEFNHSFKRFYGSLDSLKEGIDSYSDILSEYQLEVSEELWSVAINHLNK